MDRFFELSVFIAVVETGDFTRAARRLDLTPSGVSKAMTRLEERLHCVLVKRSTKGVNPTTEGCEFFEKARCAIRALEEAEFSATRVPNGVLRISCLPSFAVHQLGPLIPKFHRQYPAIRVEFTLSTDSSVLLDRRNDVGLASGIIPDTSLVARRFASSRWVTCAAPKYLETYGAPETISDLGNHTILKFSLDSAWNEWLENAPKGLPDISRSSYSANQGDMLLSLARAGAGIGRLAEYHISDDLRTGSLVEILKDQIQDKEEPLYLLYEKHRFVSKPVRAFLSFIEAEIQEGKEPWRQ